jgi:hypothetical protein
MTRAACRLDELGYTDLGDSFDEMKVRSKEKAFNFPFLYDGETGAVSRKYGPLVTPHAFVFDAERKLRYVGRIDDSEREAGIKRRDLREALDSVLAGQSVEVAETKVFGCSIKWGGKQEQVKTFMEKLAGEPVNVESSMQRDSRRFAKGRGRKYGSSTFGRRGVARVSRSSRSWLRSFACTASVTSSL